MKVVNINGTSQKTCRCGSWLAHWEKYSGQSLPVYCSERWCTGKAEVGAPVQKDGSKGHAWYIVPLCSKHNAQTGECLELVDSIKLASANVAVTCG